MVGGGSFCGDWGVFALVMDFKEVMLTSPPELAHCSIGYGGLSPEIRDDCFAQGKNTSYLPM